MSNAISATTSSVTSTARRFVAVLRRLGPDQRGVTVSAIILIGILVVAVAAFGVIATDKIGEAGEEVESVEFG